MATIKMPSATIQSLLPACKSDGRGVGLVLAGVTVISLASCVAVSVGLILIRRVAVAGIGLGLSRRVALGVGVMALGVGVMLNKTCVDGANAILENAMRRSRMEMFVI